MLHDACVIAGSASLLHLESKSALHAVFYRDQPLISGFTRAHLQDAGQQQVFIYFGACTLPAGTMLYHQSKGGQDGHGDYYMKARGSGFFSLNSRERVPAWRYVLQRNISLPVTCLHYPPLNKLVDVLPEFVAAVMPAEFELCDGHYSEGRGQTSYVGASGARFQLRAVQGREVASRVEQIQQRLKALGFLGWYGCDNIGRPEVFLRCSVIEQVLQFDGVEE